MLVVFILSPGNSMWQENTSQHSSTGALTASYVVPVGVIRCQLSVSGSLNEVSPFGNLNLCGQVRRVHGGLRLQKTDLAQSLEKLGEGRDELVSRDILHCDTRHLCWVRQGGKEKRTAQQGSGAQPAARPQDTPTRHTNITTSQRITHLEVWPDRGKRTRHSKQSHKSTQRAWVARNSKAPSGKVQFPTLWFWMYFMKDDPQPHNSWLQATRHIPVI